MSVFFCTTEKYYIAAWVVLWRESLYRLFP